MDAFGVEIGAPEFFACFIQFEQIDGAFFRVGFRTPIDEVSCDRVAVFVGDTVC